jgi:hypothetical protein
MQFRSESVGVLPAGFLSDSDGSLASLAVLSHELASADSRNNRQHPFAPFVHRDTIAPFALYSLQSILCEMIRFQIIVSALLLSALCHGQVSAGGTLVVVVPANGGIIVAADTRSTVGGVYCDGVEKLSIPKLRKNTAVFETGEGIQLPPRGHSQPLDDICRYAKSATPLLDMRAFLVQRVDAKPNEVLTKIEMQEIAQESLSKVMEYAHKYETSHPLAVYLGQDMFRAGIVSYDLKREIGSFGTFVVRIDDHGIPVLGDVDWNEFPKSEKIFVFYLGETEYVNQYVLSSAQQTLNSYNALTGKTVLQTSLSDAISAALSLITATEETTKIMQPPTGIGGPIDVITITEKGAVLERHPSSN